MESISNSEKVTYAEIPTEKEPEKETTPISTSIPSGETLGKVRAEEKHRIAEVTRAEKNQEIYQNLNKLLEAIKEGNGKDYPAWIQTFNLIVVEADRQSYRENYELFSKVIDNLIHPSEGTPATLYIPYLWDLGLNIMWLDFSKARAVEKEYFYASSQVPNILLQANKEFEAGNIDRALALIERAKGFIEMHYSNIPVLSDRRSEEKAAFTLSLSEIEKKINPEQALKTLAEYMKTQSESMNMKKFFEKWAVLIVIFYVSRRAIFG
ncbi:MAG: hypothetical protein KFB95_05365 [Simkaniaceae bacterium]|nr:MAG: hypothetical protein KFB95_05365 [Simkaniaceae bacterium]